MAQVRPKALYIGVPAVGDAIRSIRTDWDFLPTVPDIATLFSGLVDGSIDNDIQVIFVLDKFFDPSGKDTAFEKLVTMMAPHCLFSIVNYRPKHREQMDERIGYEAYSMGSDSSSLLYYYIDPSSPSGSIDNAVNHYIRNAKTDEVISILTGRTSDEERQAVIDERNREPEPEAQFMLEDDGEKSPYLGQVVAVTSSKGGSGKSTVAVSLATYLAHSSINSVRERKAEKPLKVIILDCDVRDGQLGFLTGNSKPTVINLRLSGISKQTIEQTAIYSNRLKVDLLLAPKRPRSSDDTPPEFYIELIHTLRKMYDYVIIDTSVNYLDPLLEKVAYPTADQIIFVTDIVVNSVFSMTRWIQEVTKPRDQGGMGINKNKIGIVVNKSLGDVNMPGEKIAKAALGIPVICAIPSNPKLVAHAANMQSMHVLLKHKDIYFAIKRLARGVVGNKYPLSDRVQE